ncbi:unnamed protein product [Arctogadus glacialis]
MPSYIAYRDSASGSGDKRRLNLFKLLLNLSCFWSGDCLKWMAWCVYRGQIHMIFPFVFSVGGGLTTNGNIRSTDSVLFFAVRAVDWWKPETFTCL